MIRILITSYILFLFTHSVMSQSLPDTVSKKNHQINVGINSFPFVFPYYYFDRQYLGQKDIRKFSGGGGLSSLAMYQITYKLEVKAKNSYSLKIRTGVDFYYESYVGNYNLINTKHGVLINAGMEIYKTFLYKRPKMYGGFEICFLRTMDRSVNELIPYESREQLYAGGIAFYTGVEKNLSKKFSVSSEISIIVAYGEKKQVSTLSQNFNSGFGIFFNRFLGLTVNCHFGRNKK